MKRSDIVRSIQVQFKNMKANDASAILDCVSDQLIKSIANNRRIELRGFGTFQSRLRTSKIGYNPTNKKSMVLKAGRTILFKPSRELTKKMNG